MSKSPSLFLQCCHLVAEQGITTTETVTFNLPNYRPTILHDLAGNAFNGFVLGGVVVNLMAHTTMCNVDANVSGPKGDGDGKSKRRRVAH